jgi:hypothetical protein
LVGITSSQELKKVQTDKIGITSLIENATDSATEMAKNASREIIGKSFGEQ